VTVKSGGPTQKSVDELVKRYLIDKVRAHAGRDEELFDSILALHELAEQRESSHDSAKRLKELRDSPMVRTAMAFLGERFQRLADVGIRIAEDTQALRFLLRERLGEAGIDPLNPKQRAAAEAEYERALVQTIPLPTALENVSALAEMVDLANDVLNQTGLRRHAYEAAWQFGKRAIFKDEKVLAKMEHIKTDLQGDRERLVRVSALIRKIGPGVVKDAYARGASAAKTSAAKAPAAKAGPAAAKPAPSAAAKASPARNKSGKEAPAKGSGGRAQGSGNASTSRKSDAPKRRQG
jgi:hypothetical protein